MSHRSKFFTDVCVLDTETTSLNFREAEVIEFGFVLYMNKAWKQFNELHQPSESISPHVSAVTHITDEDVDGKLSFTEAYKDFDTILENMGERNDIAIVAHNAFYDEKVFKYSVPEADVLNYDWLCTMRLAKKLYATDDTVEAFNLPYLRYRFKLDIPKDMPHHRASSDAYMTAKLLEHLVDEMEAQGIIDTNLPYKDQIITWVNEPIVFDVMPFGKHKGTKLEDVPMSYWTWALNNMDSLNEDKDEYDADFAASVVKVLENKV